MLRCARQGMGVNLDYFKPQPGCPLCDLLGLQSQALGAKVGQPGKA